ncbi:MAG: cellulase family glycosylhydrolase [Patescibacteria group bacterium]
MTHYHRLIIAYSVLLGIILLICMLSMVEHTTHYSSSNALVRSSTNSPYTNDNLGINLPWLDLHNGVEEYNWLNEKYNSKLIDKDLAEIQAMGITKIRTFCQMESLFNFKDGKFELHKKYAKNLDDFLTKAEKHNISVICVMGAGNYEGEPKSLDGNFRWELIKTPAGIKVYTDAYSTYIKRFSSHKNIIMWETHNEPYGSATWSEAAKVAQVTEDQIHEYLFQSYKTIKPLVGSTYVGFSDLEEREQPKYQLFSDEAKRTRLVDDSTDVYSLHIYRNSADQVFDFSGVKNKPKWVVEYGGYNYYDPQAIEHPIAGNSELYNTEANYTSTVDISNKLVNTGFTLLMPWAFSSNSGMVVHNPDGTHTLLKLPLWMKEQIKI